MPEDRKARDILWEISETIQNALITNSSRPEPPEPIEDPPVESEPEDLSGVEELPPEPEEGWTDLPIVGKQIFVSNAGLDPSLGTLDAPIRTLAEAYSRLTDGEPATIVLRRGDVFTEGFPKWWDKSGKSPDERIIIGTYGDPTAPRPVIHQGLYAKQLSNMALLHLDFHNVAHDPRHDGFVSGTEDGGVGLRVLGKAHDLIIEGCNFQAFKTNICFEPWKGGEMSKIDVRRCTILDAYSNDTGDRPQGLYARDVQGLILAENVFDHNGHNVRVTGAKPTVYNHNVYLKDCDGSILTDNIFANGSGCGVKMSSDTEGGYVGGSVIHNLFFNNACGLGLNKSSRKEPFAHQDFHIADNVFLHHGKILKGIHQAYGIWLMTGKGGVITRNVIADKAFPYAWAAMRIGNLPVHDCMIIENTVYNFPTTNNRESVDTFGIASLDGTVIQDNVTLSPSQFSEPDLPETEMRYDLAAYNKFIGGKEDATELLNAMRELRCHNWNPLLLPAAINSFVKGQLGV